MTIQPFSDLSMRIDTVAIRGGSSVDQPSAYVHIHTIFIDELEVIPEAIVAGHLREFRRNPRNRIQVIPRVIQGPNPPLPDL